MNPNKPGSSRNARRRAGDKKYKKYLSDLVGCGYNAGVNEKTSDNGKTYYVRSYRSPQRSKFLKKQATRKQRRTEDLPDGNGYKKASEYWWKLE